MTIATTQQGVAANQDSQAALAFNEDDAAAAFLSKWSEEDPSETVSESPEVEDEESQEPPEDTQEETAEDVEVEETEADHPEEQDSEESTEDAEDSDEEPKEPKASLEDDAVVKIKVGEEELDVSVKDLKRLYGQEAALTRKSQEVAAKRKDAEAAELKAQATLDKMYQKAVERWKPYSEIDMLVASKQLDADSFTALRKEAQAAYEDFRFITEEADAFVKASQANQQKQLQEAAQEAVKVLKEAIPNWSPKLYDSIREYAITTGMPSDVVNNLVDPVAIQLIHKARLYDEAKKVVTKKKVIQPKKVLKQTVTSTSVKSDQTAKAKTRFQSSGSVDDAANLFLSRWAASDE